MQGPTRSNSAIRAITLPTWTPSSFRRQWSFEAAFSIWLKFTGFEFDAKRMPTPQRGLAGGPLKPCFGLLARSSIARSSTNCRRLRCTRDRKFRPDWSSLSLVRESLVLPLSCLLQLSRRSIAAWRRPSGDRPEPALSGVSGYPEACLLYTSRCV